MFDARLDATQPCSTPLNRESNGGPASFAENARAIQSVDSGAESRGCGVAGESASALENRGESGACSNVANRPTAAELLEMLDAAIIALNAGETEAAGTQLQALAEAVRALGHDGGRDGV